VGKDYTTLFVLCILLVVIGISVAIWALCISQKNPSAQTIKDVIEKVSK
jgi:hypothetical protein